MIDRSAARHYSSTLEQTPRAWEEPLVDLRRALMHAPRIAVSAVAVLLIAGPAADTPADAQLASIDWSKVRVLVYTKNGKGYVHDNIPASIEAIRALAKEHRFTVDVSEDPAVFADDTLRSMPPSSSPTPTMSCSTPMPSASP